MAELPIIRKAPVHEKRPQPRHRKAIEITDEDMREYFQALEDAIIKVHEAELDSEEYLKWNQEKGRLQMLVFQMAMEKCYWNIEQMIGF